MILVNATAAANSGDLSEWLPPLIMIPIIAFIISRIVQANKLKKAREAEIRQSGLLIQAFFNHVSGLPIPENLLCEIKSYPDRLDFKAGTTNIKLLREKITDMCIKTDTEIQKQSVSSIGGAIAGGVMFGPLGAIIGGRAKTKKVKTTKKYLIITYTGEQGDLKYIGFDIATSFPLAAKLVKEFHELNTNSEIQINL